MGTLFSRFSQRFRIGTQQGDSHANSEKIAIRRRANGNGNFSVIEGAFLIFASLNPKGLLTALQQVLDEFSALYTLKAMLAGRNLPAIQQIITDKEYGKMG